MHPLPHRYRVEASGAPEGSVTVLADGVPALATQPPPEFGGPGGCWSPEALLVAAVADCYVLSFRAVARASNLAWRAISVRVEGVLDRAGGITRFTEFHVAPTLTIARESDRSLADKVVVKAEHACLVTNSLSAQCDLDPVVLVAG